MSLGDLQLLDNQPIDNTIIKRACLKYNINTELI